MENKALTEQYHQHEKSAKKALRAAEKKRDHLVDMFNEEQEPWDEHQSTLRRLTEEMQSLDSTLGGRAEHMQYVCMEMSQYGPRSAPGQSAVRRYHRLLSEQKSDLQCMQTLRREEGDEQQKWMSWWLPRHKERKQLEQPLRRAVHAAQYHAHQAKRLRLNTFGRHLPEIDDHHGRPVVVIDSGHGSAIDDMNGIFQRAGKILHGPINPATGNPMWTLDPIPFVEV